MTNLGSDILSTDELIKKCGVSLPTLKEWIREGLIKPTKLGRSNRFCPKEVAIADALTKYSRIIVRKHIRRLAIHGRIVLGDLTIKFDRRERGTEIFL